jgi:hypothetical protein
VAGSVTLGALHIGYPLHIKFLYIVVDLPERTSNVYQTKRR